MRVLIGIDDTDNLESRGTGHRARQLAATLAGHGIEPLGVTRHQLLMDPRIPYTSHNSSACIEVQGDAASADIVAICREFLIADSAPGSDAGLCVAPLRDAARTEHDAARTEHDAARTDHDAARTDHDAARTDHDAARTDHDAARTDHDAARTFTVREFERLIEFGSRAKQAVVTTDEAHRLAADARVHLEGLTGTRIGVIGALAAVGLRAGGNDGRFLWLPRLRELSGSYTAAQLREALRLDVIETEDGRVAAHDARIALGDWARPLLRGGRSVLLVQEAEGEDVDWIVAAKERIKRLSE